MGLDMGMKCLCGGCKVAINFAEEVAELIRDL